MIRSSNSISPILFNSDRITLNIFAHEAGLTGLLVEPCPTQEMLTFACRRASKLREEGRAHFSLGVLRDNLGQYLKAIEAYTQFLGFAWIAFISQFISQLFGEPSENI